MMSDGKGVGRVWLFAVMWSLVSCGQEPAFRDIFAQGGKGHAESPSDKGKKGGVTEPGQDAANGMGEGQDGMTDGGAAGGTDGMGSEDGNPPIYDDGTGGGRPIPGLDPSDSTALHRCMSKWNELPDELKQPDRVRKVKAAVTVGGFGSALQDVERTDEPELVLVEAAVSVFGSPVFELLNPNGYYCIKTNVAVLTDLTVKLHCNARLADNQVGVNVGSVMNGSVSRVGVHVLSKVTIDTVRPEGDSCLR